MLVIIILSLLFLLYICIPYYISPIYICCYFPRYVDFAHFHSICTPLFYRYNYMYVFSCFFALYESKYKKNAEFLRALVSCLILYVFYSYTIVTRCSYLHIYIRLYIRFYFLHASISCVVSLLPLFHVLLFLLRFPLQASLSYYAALWIYV